MRAFAILTAVLLGVIGVGIGIESSSSTSPNPPTATGWTIQPRTPLVSVAPKGPCPTSVRGDNDVANAEDSLASQLLPPDALFGIICRYASTPGHGRFALVRSALVNGRTARAFEAVIRELRTTRPRGITMCPAAFAQVTVLAFGFANSDQVDLWNDDSGCQTLDNGYLESSETANPPFLRFAALVSSIAPIANG